jgi:hypothetical protein
MKARPLLSALLISALATSAFAQKEPAPKDQPTLANPGLVGVRAPWEKKAPAPAPQPEQQPVVVPTGPEPTGVYGWIAIVDPQSGQAWLPLDYEQNPPPVHGYPTAINVQFIRSDGGEQRSVALAGGEGLRADRERGAWRYSIRFDHVATMTGPPAVGDPGAVRYNPAQWRFVNVTVDEYRWSVLGRGSTTVLWSVPFARRGALFDWPVTP